ncbi:retrovirus-related pol polyprotein from transposon TNT 1-94 [Tanacetum coccineum]
MSSSWKTPYGNTAAENRSFLSLWNLVQFAIQLLSVMIWANKYGKPYIVDFDELTSMASKQFSSGPGPQLLTPGTLSLGLPMFDEYFNPPPSVASLVPAVVAPDLLNSKEALKEAYWIKTMQEELNAFKHLKVWELIPRPDRVMVITLKWIFKVNLDELGGVLKNKDRLVARGYRQEEGIDFEESFTPVA